MRLMLLSIRTAVILALLYIPHLTSLFRLFAFAYPNTTVRWGRHRMCSSQMSCASRTELTCSMPGYGKMAINILQRYYTVELLWMKYIGMFRRYCCLSFHDSRCYARFLSLLCSAPVYAGMAIYFTWLDHGRPELWHLPQNSKRTVSVVSAISIFVYQRTCILVFDYRFIPSLRDL